MRGRHAPDGHQRVPGPRMDRPAVTLNDRPRRLEVAPQQLGLVVGLERPRTTSRTPRGRHTGPRPTATRSTAWDRADSRRGARHRGQLECRAARCAKSVTSRVRSAAARTQRCQFGRGIRCRTSSRRATWWRIRGACSGVLCSACAAECLVVLEDRLFKLPKLWAGLQTDLVKRRTRIAICGERLGVTTCPV